MPNFYHLYILAYHLQSHITRVWICWKWFAICNLSL